MKFQVVGILALIFTIQFSATTAAIDDTIINFLEELRLRMCHPIDKLGLPALDPFEIAHKEVYLDDRVFIDFSASVTNLRATGLSDFIINQIKISTLTRKFTFDLTFPMTKLDTKYTAKGSLAYFFNLVGDDDFAGYLGGFRIIITGAMKLSSNFGIKNLSIKLYATDLSVEFGRLMEDERLNDFFHDLMNQRFPEIIGDLYDDYGVTYTTKLENLINKFGSNYTLKDLIAMITGSGSGEPIFGDDPPPDCKDAAKLPRPKTIIQKLIEPTVIQQN